MIASSLLPGCFYTDPVNRAPTAEIRQVGEGPVRVHDVVTLSADQSLDPDGQVPEYLWLAESCPDVGLCTMIATGSAQDFTFVVPDHDRVAVTLTAVDVHNARHEVAVELFPENRLPEAEIDVRGPRNLQGGYTVGRALDVRGVISDGDDDEVTPTFVVYPPAASVTYGWERVDDLHYLLTPDVTGTWTIELSAVDELGAMSGVDTASFVVDEDQPPCIGATTPAADAGRIIVERAEAPRRFAVESVLDDVDPWPVPWDASAELGGARFRWLVDGAVADGLTLPELWFDASGRDPGEVLTIRVEVSDRVARELPCDDATPVCPVDGCARRLTWEVEVR